MKVRTINLSKELFNAIINMSRKLAYNKKDTFDCG